MDLSWDAPSRTGPCWGLLKPPQFSPVLRGAHQDWAVTGNPHLLLRTCTRALGLRDEGDGDKKGCVAVRVPRGPHELRDTRVLVCVLPVLTCGCPPGWPEPVCVCLRVPRQASCFWPPCMSTLCAGQGCQGRVTPRPEVCSPSAWPGPRVSLGPKSLVRVGEAWARLRILTEPPKQLHPQGSIDKKQEHEK